MSKQETKFEFCTHEQHGGVCKLTGEYCSLGPCPNEDIEEFVPVRHGRWKYNTDFQVGTAPSVAKISIRAQELSPQRKNCQPTARTAAQ